MGVCLRCPARCVLALVCAGTVHGQNNGRLTGTIEDQVFEPVAGVSVALMSLDRVVSTKSAANGFFAFDDVAASSYEVEATGRGFAKQRLSVNLPENAAWPPLSITLTAGNQPDQELCGSHSVVTYGRPGSTAPRVNGFVRDFVRPKAIANAEVMVSGIGDIHAVFQSTAGGDGKFTLEKLPPGYYAVHISRQGYWPVEIKRVLVPRENAVFVETQLLRRNQMIVCQ